MSSLDAPKDLSLHPIWNHAIGWVRYTGGDPYLHEDVFPAYERFLAMPNPPHPFETPYQFPMEGYILRKITWKDIPQLSVELAAPGHFDVEMAVRLLNNDLYDPFSWSFVWEYKGKIIQYECAKLGLDGKCYMGHTIHIDHARPHQFWRESQEPVWKALKDAGYTGVHALIRKEHKDYWLPVVMALYNMKQTGETEKAILVEYSTTDTKFQGWPERRTLGPDWEYRDGNLVVTEAKDMAEISAWVREKWKNSSRLPMMETILDTWYNLDFATCLVTRDSGTIVDVRLIRSRNKTKAGIGILIPMAEIPDVADTASHEWARKVGYEKITSMITEKDSELPVFKKFYGKHGYKVLGNRKYAKYTYVERELTL